VVRYITQRLVSLVVVLFIVSLGSFFLIHLLPGNPAIVICGGVCLPSALHAIDGQLGLNHPLYLQYFYWISHVLQGNLGSNIQGNTVASVIEHGLPIDLELFSLSQVIAIGVAMPLAFRAARHPNGVFDRIATTTSFIMLAMPAYVLIVVLEDLIGNAWGVAPAVADAWVPGGDWVFNAKCLILPACVLAIGSFVIYYRILRSDLIATFQEDFMTMARSKGLSRRRIIWRHALRPSSISLVSVMALAIGGIVTGDIIVEFQMGIPGLGYLLLEAISTTDFVSVQGIVLIFSALTVVAAISVDILYGIIDPRISRG
jgi:peptide/nickel transport system permease protein